MFAGLLAGLAAACGLAFGLEAGLAGWAGPDPLEPLFFFLPPMKKVRHFKGNEIMKECFVWDQTFT